MKGLVGKSIRRRTAAALVIAFSLVVFVPGVYANVLAAEPIIITDQAVGMGISREDGSLYAMDLLAAERNTGLYAKLDAEDAENIRSLSMSIEGNGRGETFFADDYDLETGLVSFHDGNVKLSAGEYRLMLTDGDIQVTKNVQVRDMKDIRILAVPIQGRYGQETYCADTEGVQLDTYTREVYPLGDHDLEWDWYDGRDCELTGQTYNLDSPLGRYRVWSFLKGLQDEEMPYTLIVGLTSENMLPGPGSGERSITGFTFGEPVCVVSLKDTSPAVTVAHEIGHCYLLGDEYENGTINLETNMVPFGMKGKNRRSLTEVVQGDCPFIFGGAGDTFQGTGTLVTSGQYPYNALTGELIDRDMTSFMGLSGYSQREYWTTPAIWEAMYEALTE